MNGDVVDRLCRFLSIRTARIDFPWRSNDLPLRWIHRSIFCPCLSRTTSFLIRNVEVKFAAHFFSRRTRNHLRRCEDFWRRAKGWRWSSTADRLVGEIYLSVKIHWGTSGVLSHSVTIIEIQTDLLEHSLIQKIGKRRIGVNSRSQQTMNQHIGVSVRRTTFWTSGGKETGLYRRMGDVKCV